MTLGKTDQIAPAPAELIDAVLLVPSDAGHARGSYAALLVAEGYLVTEAHDVEAAVAAVAAHDAALVFVTCTQRGRALTTFHDTLRPLKAIGVPLVLLSEGWEARLRDGRRSPLSDADDPSPASTPIDRRRAPSIAVAEERRVSRAPDRLPAVCALPERRATSEGSTVKRRRIASAASGDATTTTRGVSSNLSRARDDIRRACETWQAAYEHRQRTRRAIAAVDDLISEVEEVNLLRGAKTSAAMFKTKLLGVESAAGPAPAAVKAASNTARLHGGLMDWLEDLLTESVPERALHPDREDDAA